MKYFEDTIASIATGNANSAISIVRVSGTDAIKIVNKIMRAYLKYARIQLFFRVAILQTNYSVVCVWMLCILAVVTVSYELELFARLGLSQALLNQSIFNLNK